MRKFVGSVNGKRFDNMLEFSKAALEALAKNDDTISITSYFSDCDDNCNCEKCGEKEEEKVIVPVLMDDSIKSKRDINGNPTWEIQDEFKEKVGLISDKNRNDLLDLVRSRVRNYELALKEHKKKIDEYETMFKNAEDGCKYYSEVLDLLLKSKRNAEKPKEDAPRVVKTTVQTDDGSLENLWEDIGTSFGKWLKDIGFWDTVKA